MVDAPLGGLQIRTLVAQADSRTDVLFATTVSWSIPVSEARIGTGESRERP